MSSILRPLTNSAAYKPVNSNSYSYLAPHKSTYITIQINKYWRHKPLPDNLEHNLEERLHAPKANITHLRNRVEWVGKGERATKCLFFIICSIQIT